MCESLHNVIKEEQRHQSLDLVNFIENITEKVIDRQENELIKAVRGLGQFRLSQPFQQNFIAESEWQQMNIEQRKAKIEKLFHGQVQSELSETYCLSKRLLVSVDEVKNDLQFPYSLLKKQWHAAEYIVNHGSITLLPKGNYCITDENYGYNVFQDRNKKWNCCCDISKKNGGLCGHLLALHNELGDLLPYLEELTATNATIIHKHAPSRGGDKPCQKKKRKGKNNVTTAPITSVVTPIKLVKGPNGQTRHYDCDWDAPKPCIHDKY